MSDTGEPSENVNVASEVTGVKSEVELLRWEVSLLQREKELIEREQLLRGRSANGVTNTGEQGSARTLNSDVISDNERVEVNETVNSDVEKVEVFRLGSSEINHIIPPFDPASRNTSPVEWVHNIENLAKIYLWDNRTVFFYATMRLVGAAKSWYFSRQKEINSWVSLKTELVKSFPNFEDNSSILMEIMSRKKTPNEPVETYFYHIAELAARINLPEISTIKFIISGLTDQNLKNVLTAANCRTLNELLTRIKMYEEIEAQGQRRHNFISARRVNNNNKDESERLNRGSAWSNAFSYENNKRKSGQQKGELFKNDSKRPRLSEKKRCYRCDEEGHVAANCPIDNKSRRCYVCKGIGHFARDCSRKRENFERVGCVNSENVSTEKDEYHKIIEIKGKRILAFLDLGSECTTIKEEIARQNGFSWKKSDRVLYGFGRVATKASGEFKELISVGEIQKFADIVVVPDNTQIVPMIVGRNVIDQPDVKIVKTWNKLEIMKTNRPGNEKNPQEMENQASILVMHQVDTELCNIGLEELKTDDQTTINEKLQLMNLVNKYRKCFAVEMRELGKTSLVKMKITLKENKIIRYNPYKVPYGLKGTLRTIINKLLASDIIQVSTSEYASPVLLVPKKNGEFRMCVDYRRLNSITRRENFPTPNIEETLNSLANKKIFTSLDMMSGYHQVSIAEESRHLTAFVTPEGHYEFKRVPFGLTNSPAVFMRLMSKIIQPIACDQIIVYMDDVLIATATIEENLDILTKLLEEVRKAGVTLNLKKCTFFANQLEFLGHEISGEGLKPGSNKTTAIEKFKQPTCVKEVRQFLGLAGYFRRFVKGFSTIASPLTKLLKKDAVFEWTDDTESSFKTIKSILVRRPVLTLYDYTCDHEVHTDASSLGLAGILMQRDKDNNLKPVAYFSRSTTPGETKYHSYELEALAVVESLEKFKHYLLHKNFKIVTDCNSLRLTQEKKNLIPRIARWWMRISEFQFELVFRPGQQLPHVDALSRCCTEEGRPVDNVADKVLIIGISEEDWISTLQQQDLRLNEIRKVLEGSILKHDNLHGIKGNYVLEKGRVCKKTSDGNKFVVPNGLRCRVIQSAHDYMGHCGVERTLDHLRRTFWFQNMKPIVKKYINSCIDCLYNKQSFRNQVYQLYTPQRQPIPFYTVHCDHLGPFPRSKTRNTHVIGLIDSFTKFIVLKPVRSTNTKGIIRMLDEVTQYFGLPTEFVSDRGSSFTSKEFSKYCAENSIKHIQTAVQTPRANGQIERYFRTVKSAIATMSQDDDGKDWDTNLPTIQWALNSLRHTITRKTPHELLMAYKPRTILKNKLLLALHDYEYTEEDEIPLAELRDVIKRKTEEKQTLQAANFNEKHQSPRKYQVGDLVLIRQEAPATGQPRKVIPRYKGPYLVKAVLPHDRYVICDADMIKLKQRSYESVHSADHLKPWCKLEDLIVFDDYGSDEE